MKKIEELLIPQLSNLQSRHITNFKYYYNYFYQIETNAKSSSIVINSIKFQSNHRPLLCSVMLIKKFKKCFNRKKPYEFKLWTERREISGITKQKYFLLDTTIAKKYNLSKQNKKNTI